MSKQADLEKTQSHEADSAILGNTITDSKSAELRAKVSGKFLRLTMAHNGIPIFVRSDNIGAYHDQIDEQKGFQGCWLTGTSFGFSVKEHAEDIQALIGMVEGEYSRSELGEALIALLIAGGMGATESRGLLSSGPREKLSAEVVSLSERLQLAGDREKWLDTVQSQLNDLADAGSDLAAALGEKDRFNGDEFDDDPAAATIFCMKQSVARLGAQSGLRQSLADAQRQHEELMQASESILTALGISDAEFDKEAGHGRDDHGAMLRMLGRAVELIGGLKERADNAEVDANDLRKKLLTSSDRAKAQEQAIESQQEEIERQQEEIEKQRREIAAISADAAANLKTCDELSLQVSELEDRLAVTTQDRKDAEDRAACLEKDADKLRARLADALRQLPEPVERDLERVWAIREAAGGQS